MAEDKNIAIEVEVKGVEKSIESMKDLKNAIKAAKDEQVKMAASFGEGSKEYLDATKKLSGLKDKVDDLNDSTQSLKGTGFEQLNQGFAQMKDGIMNLDFDKVKSGLTAMKSGIGAFADSAKTALQSVKGAIIATGIGALVVALGAIYLYWDDIKGAIDGVSAEQKKLNELTKANFESEKEKLTTLNSQDNNLKLQGKSEREILKIKIAQLDAITAAGIAQYESTITTQKSQKAAAERNKEILLGILNFMNIPMQTLLKTIDSVGTVLGKNFGLAKGFQDKIDALVLSGDKELEDKQAKELADQQKGLEDLKNQRAGFQLSIKKIDADAAKTSSENKKKAAEDAKKLIDDLIAYNKLADIENQKIDNADALTRANLRVERNQDDISAKINLLNVQKSIELQNKELTTKEIELIEQKHLTNIENLKKAANTKILADKNKDDIAGAQLKVAQDATDMNAKIALLTAQKDIELQNANLTANEKLLINQKYENDVTELKKAEGEKQAADEKQARDNNFAAAQSALTSLQSLSDAFFEFKRSGLKKGSAEELAAAKKQFNINKGIAIASATISGIQGVINALTAQSVIPEPFGTILKAATAVGVGAAAAVNIAKISKSKFDAGGGGGGGDVASTGMPSIPIPSPPTLNTPNANTNSGTTFDSTGKNTSATTPTINVNATIGVDEINSKQNRVSVLEKQSTF